MVAAAGKMEKRGKRILETEDDKLVGWVLPEELETEILLRLPVKSLFRFKCVCKSWMLVIKTSSFRFQHFLLQKSDKNNSTKSLNLLFQVYLHDEKIDIWFDGSHILDYDTLAPVGLKLPRALPWEPRFDQNSPTIMIGCSCDGLFLCSYYNCGYGLFLWNPTTAETKRLPYSKTSKPGSLGATVGFGFDITTMDYKVVAVYSTAFPNTKQFEMYSLKSNSWKTIAIYPGPVCFSINSLPGVLSNGILSWKIRDHKVFQIYKQPWDTILSLQLSNGTIITTPLPNSVLDCYKNLRLLTDYYRYDNNYLLDYKDSLAFVDYVESSHHFERTFNIWVLGEYGVQKSWNKLFTVGPCQGICEVLGFWKDDQLFAYTFGKEVEVHQLQEKKTSVIYETELLLLDSTLPPNQQQPTKLHTFVHEQRHFKVFTYKENLVPLNEL